MRIWKSQMEVTALSNGEGTDVSGRSRCGEREGEANVGSVGLV